jgi:hypothetical protein
MVIACRWVIIWRARHNHKIYGETEPYFLLDQSRARIFPSFMVMVMVTVDRWRRSYAYSGVDLIIAGGERKNRFRLDGPNFYHRRVRPEDRNAYLFLFLRNCTGRARSYASLAKFSARCSAPSAISGSGSSSGYSIG